MPDGPGPPLTPTVFHVLLAQSDGALHGYAVMKRVEADSGLAMGPGSVYGALQRLGEAGWIDVADPAPAEARRARTFTLSPQGRQALRREGKRLARLSRRVDSRALAPAEGPNR